MIEHSVLDIGFRPLLDASPDVTVVGDSLGKIVVVNQEVEGLLGWAEAELVGQPMNRLIPPKPLADIEGEVAVPCFQRLV